MSNWMQKYYQKQPEALQSVKEGVLASLLESDLNQSGGRLVLIGSGSSYYAALAAKPHLERLMGIEVALLLPSAIQEGFRTPAEKDRIILISQEGRSVNTYHAGQLLHRRGLRYRVLTAAVNAPVALEADWVTPIACGEERSGPKTKGVLGTVMALLVLGTALGAREGVLTDAQCAYEMALLDREIKLLAENIRRSTAWRADVGHCFEHATSATVICPRSVKGLADDGVLKLVETLYLPACCYEMEEFIHGPHCLLGARTLLILIHTAQEEPRQRGLAEFALSKGMSVLEISDEEETEDFSGLRLLPSGACPLHLLLPFQAVSAFVAEEMGHDLDTPKFPGFATALGSKLSQEGLPC